MWHSHNKITIYSRQGQDCCSNRVIVICDRPKIKLHFTVNKDWKKKNSPIEILKLNMAVHLMLCLGLEIGAFFIHVIISKSLLVANVSQSQWLCNLRCRWLTPWILQNCHSPKWKVQVGRFVLCWTLVSIIFPLMCGPYTLNVAVVVDLHINNSGQAVTTYTMKVCTNQGCLVAQV